jgi:hypothetical protein
MGKKHMVIICMLLVFLLAFISLVKFNRGYKITVINNSDKVATNLELKYKVGDTIQTIPKIKAKKSWKYNIDTSSLEGENAIILTYKDNKDNLYEESVVGYMEKGYNGQANVEINKVDENGKLEIEVK